MTDAAKAELRARMRRLRRRLARQFPEAPAQAAFRLPESLLTASVVGGYAPVGSEFDPCPVMTRFADAGCRLARPAVRDMHGSLAFHAWRQGDSLRPDILGIPAPLEASQRLDPDLILAPVLAFDRGGGRLGQGGGYFDRTIADLRAKGPLRVIGLAFAGQEVDDVPMEAHDARLDAILTEAEFIEPAAPTRRSP